MKTIKKLITAAAAAVCMLSCSLTGFAEGENVVVTTTTGTSAEGQNGVVWTQLTQEKTTNGLDNNAVQLSVSVSNIEDGKFTAVLNVSTKEKIALIQGSIGYNKDEYRLTSAQLAQDDGGVLVEDKAEGKYSFTYSSEAGSDRSGEYIKLGFEMIKPSEKNDVLFLTIDNVLDMQTQSLNFGKSDGIIDPTGSPSVSQDVKAIRLAAFARPYTFEELGFADVINCEVEESQVAKYSEGGIVAMTPGTVSAKLINKDYTIQKVRIEVYSAQDGDEPAAPGGDKKEDTKTQPQKAKTSVNVGVPLLLIAALSFALFITAKSRKRKASPANAQRQPVRNGSYEPRYQAQRRDDRRRPRYPADPRDRYPRDSRPPRHPRDPRDPRR